MHIHLTQNGEPQRNRWGTKKKKKKDMTRERISLILESIVMFLTFQMNFSLVTAAVVLAILENTSGFDPSSDTKAP